MLVDVLDRIYVCFFAALRSWVKIFHSYSLETSIFSVVHQPGIGRVCPYQVTL